MCGELCHFDPLFGISPVAYVFSLCRWLLLQRPVVHRQTTYWNKLTGSLESEALSRGIFGDRSHRHLASAFNTPLLRPSNVSGWSRGCFIATVFTCRPPMSQCRCLRALCRHSMSPRSENICAANYVMLILWHLASCIRVFLVSRACVATTRGASTENILPIDGIVGIRSLVLSRGIFGDRSHRHLASALKRRNAV
jgi:hypothetical protein